MKVAIYTVNKGTAAQYFGLKNAEENTVLHAAPNNWKTKRGAINWAKKHGYELPAETHRVGRLPIYGRLYRKSDRTQRAHGGQLVRGIIKRMDVPTQAVRRQQKDAICNIYKNCR